METGNPPDQCLRERRTGASAERLRIWRRLSSYPRALAVARETRVGTTPCDVVYESGTHRLLRYRRETRRRGPSRCSSATR